MLKFTDSEPSTLAYGISATDTSFTFTSGGGSTYENGSFCVTLCDTSVSTGNFGFLSAKETIFVGRRIGDVCSQLVRGWASDTGGGSPRAWSAGTVVASLIPAKVLNLFAQFTPEQMAKLSQLIDSQSLYSGLPVGFITICGYGSGGLVIPEERLLYCNGRAIDRAAYPDLFAKIGVTWGSGDGSTTFNLPDARGVVFRGIDDGRGLDTNSSRVVGSYQDDALQNIVGNFYVDDRSGGDGLLFTQTSAQGTTYGAEGTSDHTYAQIRFDASRVVKTDNETRMKNHGVKYYIRY
jgi:hypothetical protein